MFDNDCNCKGKNKECCRDRIVIAVALILFAFVIGVLVGATTGFFALIGQSILTLIAIALGVIALIRLAILVLCCKKDC